MRTKHLVITHKMLKDANACSEQRELFVEIFGYKATATRANLIKAFSNGLQSCWFMKHFGSRERYPEARRRFLTLRNYAPDYNEKRADIAMFSLYGNQNSEDSE